MSRIENIMGFSSGMRQPHEAGQVQREENGNLGKTLDPNQLETVQTEFPAKARMFLSLTEEAATRVVKAPEAERLCAQETVKLKGCISSQYYFNFLVIDKIVDRLLRTVTVQRIK